MAEAFAIPFQVGQDDARQLNMDGPTGLEALQAIGALVYTYRLETRPPTNLKDELQHIRIVATDAEGTELAHRRCARA